MIPQRGKEQLTGHWPCYAVYETRDARFVTVGAYEPHFWATLCRHFGREDFVPEQFTEARREEMFRFFRAAFREKTLEQWMAELGGKEICFGPVLNIEEAYDDPQLRHRGMVVDTETPAGRRSYIGSPIKLSEMRARVQPDAARARRAHRRGAARPRLCGRRHRGAPRAGRDRMTDTTEDPTWDE